MSKIPKVSCFCCTYGRPSLVEEALESFLRQDYTGQKELVILNDFEGHVLHYDHPEVIIVNSKKRIEPLGRKFNVAASMCTGDVILPWEDDDIYLPWRISYAIDNLKEGVFHTRQGWLETNDGRFAYSENLYHCNLAVTRERWEAVGGYLEEDVSAIDLDLYRRLEGEQASQTIPEERIFYVYRWETSGSYHGSAMGGLTDGISQAAASFVATEMTRGKVPAGDVHLKPHWRRDYVDSARRAIRDGEIRTNWRPRENHHQPLLHVSLPWHPGVPAENNLVVPTPDRRRLVLLNPTARAIWQELTAGNTSAEIAGEIARRFNIAVSHVQQDVEDLIQQWYEARLMVDHESPDLCLRSHGRLLLVNFPDQRVKDLVKLPLRGIAVSESSGWDHLVEVRMEQGLYALYEDQVRLSGEHYPDEVAHRVVDRVLQPRNEDDRFVLRINAAAVIQGDTAILLAGDEGSGKSTLAASLLAKGYDLLGDNGVDILHEDCGLDVNMSGLAVNQISRRLLGPRLHGQDREPTFMVNGEALTYISAGTVVRATPLRPARTVLLVLDTQATVPATMDCSDRLELLSTPAFTLPARISDQALQSLLDWLMAVEAIRLPRATLGQMNRWLQEMLTE